MKEVGLISDLLEMVSLFGLPKYRKVGAAALVLLGCLVSGNVIKTYVQPANAMGLGAAAPIAGFDGDEKAYYCARHSLQGLTVAAACQAPEMAVNSFVTAHVYTWAAYTGDCGAYDAIFRRYGWSVPTAEAICQAESGGNPNSVSPTNDYGLMQLHDMAIFDPTLNIAMAYRKYQAQGWNAWTSYNTGAYARYD